MSEIWIVEVTKDDGATWELAKYGILTQKQAEFFAAYDNEYYLHARGCSYWRERPALYVRVMESIMETPMEEPTDACRGTEKAEKKGK